MSNEVNAEQILQAITELSQQLSQTDEKLDNAEKRLDHKITKNAEKIDNVDAKLSVLSDNLLHTQAEVKQLKDAK